ncbi:hypothetical protein NEDG_00059 [Nematocida displodere]|uniref:Uncharacterized protein n=1 Tax=Nematocida displodere TaxID=1805483 RepID=A0A177EHX7_9MICR|nr:hypothetical protein NEDG_00059 [Nematocida displodere]
MDKKYNGLVFSKEAVHTPRNQEEKEIFDILNRKIHDNELEDDFFDLANGQADERDLLDSESDIEEVDDAEYYTHTHTPSTEHTSTTSTAPSLDKNSFSALINEMNSCSGREFSMFNSFFEKKKSKPQKKKSATGRNIDQCNSILNRLGALYQPIEEKPKEKKPKTHKVPETCGNWEDNEEECMYQPRII